MLHANAQPDIEEIRVACAPLPHPRTTNDRVQLLRVTVDEELAPALLLSGALHFVAIIVELTQVAAALLFLFTPAYPASAPESPAEHQGAEPDQTDHREESGLQRSNPRCIHHHQGADDPNQQRGKRDHQQDVARLTLRQRQRRCDRDSNGRNARRCLTGTTEKPRLDTLTPR